MSGSLFDTSSWFYQCTCFAFGVDEQQTIHESGLSLLDEHGKPIEDEKSAAAAAAADDTGLPEQAQETKEETHLPTSSTAISDGSTVAVAAAATGAAAASAGKSPQQQVAASGKATHVGGKHAPPARQTSRPRSSEVSIDLKAFTEDLKVGIPFKKHCRDGSIRKRLLVLDESQTKLGWKENQNPNTMIRLADVLEIRNATQLDPSTVRAHIRTFQLALFTSGSVQVGDPDHPQGMGGTATLRRTVDGTSARRAFSFILNGRTLDIEMPTEIEARRLSASFRSLVHKIKSEDSGAR